MLDLGALLLTAALGVPAIGTSSPTPAWYAGAQEDDGPARPTASGAIDAEALRRWQAITDALRTPESRDRRIDAFEISFDLRARRGAQSNDLQIGARFLAPDWLAFTDQLGRQVGLGPRGPWLEERDGAVVRLEGREYRQDRRNLDRTRSLARNYLALTDPGGIRIDSLRTMDGPPPSLPRIRGVRPGRLAWIELVTPDFGVVGDPPESLEEALPDFPPPGAEGPFAPPQPPGEGDEHGDPVEARDPRFRVYLGCDPSEGLPVLVVISSAEPLPDLQRVEHCIHLREFQPNRRTRGLLLPWRLDVFERWPALEGFADYPEVPSQEIDLVEARVDNLDLTPESFVPPALAELER